MNRGGFSPPPAGANSGSGWFLSTTKVDYFHPLQIITILLLFLIMTVKYEIRYYSADVQQEIRAFPKTLKARFIRYTVQMIESGANIGEPHTKAFGDGLFELRLKGQEGIARVFYCTQIGRKIVMLHSFMKKTQKTPLREKEIAMKRLQEVKNGKTTVA